MMRFSVSSILLKILWPQNFLPLRINRSYLHLIVAEAGMDDEMAEEEVAMEGDTHRAAKPVVNLGIELKNAEKDLMEISMGGKLLRQMLNQVHMHITCVCHLWLRHRITQSGIQIAEQLIM